MITERQREILRHSLGLNYRPNHFRNSYCTSPDTEDWQEIEALIAAGLMKRGYPLDDGSGLVYFYVTAEGKIEALKEAA